MTLAIPSPDDLVEQPSGQRVRAAGGVRAAPPRAGVADLIAAGERALHHEGRLAAARRWFDLAYQLAEQSADGESTARAALGLGGLWLQEHRSATTAALVRVRQEQALRNVDERSPLARRLRIRLAGEDDYRAGGSDRIMAELAEAERGDDPVAYAEALSLAHNCLLGPGHEERRAVLAQRLVTVAMRTGRRSDLLMGLLWQTVDQFLADDLHARRRLAELLELLDEQDHLAVAYVVRALETMLALRAGALDLAEARAQACARIGADAGDVDATAWHGAQLVAIRWFQGRLAELLPMLSELVHSPTLSTIDNSFVAAYAVAAAGAGQSRDAAGALARLRGQGIDEQRRDGLGGLPRSSTWLVTVYGVVEAAYLLGDADSAAEAASLLLDVAQLPMMASLGVACFGSTQQALGVAALTLGDDQRAVAALRAAVRHNLAIGHWPALALSRWRLGEALSRCGDVTGAARSRAAAVEDARLIGMVLPEAPQSRRPHGRRLACRRDGTHWVIGTVRVRHCVGLQHLAVLLANPGREVLAIDLVAGPGGLHVRDAGGSDQPVLDDTARQEYRRRLSELDADIEDAERDQDLERAGQLRLERDWLTSELTSAVGLHGRPRTFVDDQERARVAVGKAIRRALERIAQVDPALAEELRATVHTGLRCSYRPR